MPTLKLFILFISLFIHSICAEVKLPEVFSDNMVLQRNKGIPVWGTALPNEEIKVNFAGQDLSAKADEYGRWKLTLKALKANSTGQLLTVNHVRIKNVLIGDVWLCSGTANMDYPLRKCPQATKELKNAKNVLIRLATVAKKQAPLPNKNVAVHWRPVDPESVRDFSALAYIFGKNIQHQLNIPIGIIQASKGGTPITSWIPGEGFRDTPELKWAVKQIYDGRPSTEIGKKSWERYLKDMKAWIPKAREALAKKQIPEDRPEIPSELWITNIVPTKMFNGMIHPLIPFSISGVIWDHGNISKPQKFFYRKKALIESWRKLWNQENLPFYFVEPLASTEATKAIQQCLTIKNTAMAISADLQTENPKGPQNKSTIALRLAQIAIQGHYRGEVPSVSSKVIQLLIGTGSQGVYSAHFNSESSRLGEANALLSQPGSVIIKSSKDSLLYTAGNVEGRGVIKSFLKNKMTGEIRGFPKDPCYLSLDKSSKFAFTANIRGKSISSFSLNHDGSLNKLIQNLEIKTPNKGFAPHSIIPSPENKYLFVADIGGKRICRIKFNENKGLMIYEGDVTSKNFNGPRHMTFGPEGKFLYLLNQMGGAVTVFKYVSENGQLEEVQHISSLPKNFSGNNHSADLRIHPSGNFLYCTNRGPDSICLFMRDKKEGTLKFIGTVSSEGKNPVSLMIPQDGKYLFCANHKSNNIALFKIDMKNGSLTYIKEISVPGPVSLQFSDRAK